MDVADRLWGMMQQANVLSASQLQRISGVSQTQISRILRGASSPTVETLEILCKALGTDAAQFFQGEATHVKSEFENRYEQELISAYRTLPTACKEVMMIVVRLMTQINANNASGPSDRHKAKPVDINYIYDVIERAKSDHDAHIEPSPKLEPRPCT